jgi:hypothetical protein
MATRKQRRRREKERRHEYEYVYVDDEGKEVASEESEGGKPKPSKSEKKPATKTAARGRQIQPPSWQRVFKRAGLFAPLIVIAIYLLKPKNASTFSVIVQAVILIAIFVPFSYFMDSLLWRSYRKRTGAGGSEPKAKGK